MKGCYEFLFYFRILRAMFLYLHDECKGLLISAVLPTSYKELYSNQYQFLHGLHLNHIKHTLTSKMKVE